MYCIKLNGNGGTISCSLQTDGSAWRVKCSEKSMRRIQEWSQDQIMKKMLEILRCIPNILVPQDIPRKSAKSYSAKPPDRGTGWFCASELSDLQSLQEHNNITVNELWTAAANLCQTLRQLYSLGIWGNAGRGSILLRKNKNLDLKYCLTGITDFHVYQYSQVFQKAACGDENPVTTGMRFLIGGVALCTDLDKDEDSLLERQMGAVCTEFLGTFFRSPTRLSPEQFLDTAEKKLRLVAAHLRLRKLKELCLYLVVLGSDCRGIAVPALGSLIRSFYRCAQGLDLKHDTKFSVACIYPWDTVCMRKSDEGYIYALSALHQNQGGEKRVLLEETLDCLNQELEQTIGQGIGALVCYIALPVVESDPALTGMDIALFQELKQKHQAELCEAFICSPDLRQRVPHGYKRLHLFQKVISEDTVDAMMCAAVNHMLSIRLPSLKIDKVEM